MPFDVVGQVGPKNDVLDGDPDPLTGRGNFFFWGGNGVAQCNI